MKIIRNYIILLIMLLFIGGNTIGQEVKKSKIKWYDLEEALKLNKKKPKKIFIDMYTDWCGWCKKMDQSTFADPVIVKYMNEHYYPVKFNAETNDTVMFNNKVYVNPNPTGKRSSHKLAVALMQGRMSFPSYVFMNEGQQVITIVPGYRKSPEFETIMHYIAEDAYQKEKWETFSAGFQGSY